jgi:hypothetical protein
MLSRSVSAIAAKNANSIRPAGVVDARQRAGEHFQDQAVRGQVIDQGGQLRGVAAVRATVFGAGHAPGVLANISRNLRPTLLSENGF